jgi:hypothetical protein
MGYRPVSASSYDASSSTRSTSTSYVHQIWICSDLRREVSHDIEHARRAYSYLGSAIDAFAQQQVVYWFKAILKKGKIMATFKIILLVELQ